MPALTVPALAAAILISLAGAQKVVDPTMTAGALRSLGWPSSALLVRLGAAAELALGVTAIALGGPLVWGLVSISYLAFAGFVEVARRSRTMIGTCGCFGRAETPPSSVHVVINLLIAAVTAVGAVRIDRSLVDHITEAGWDGAGALALALLVTAGLLIAFVELPRAINSGSWVRPAARRAT